MVNIFLLIHQKSWNLKRVYTFMYNKWDNLIKHLLPPAFFSILKWKEQHYLMDIYSALDYQERRFFYISLKKTMGVRDYESKW